MLVPLIQNIIVSKSEINDNIRFMFVFYDINAHGRST